MQQTLKVHPFRIKKSPAGDPPRGWQDPASRLQWVSRH
ncbi:hypothetical protein [Lacticaseibacillus camelliae]